MTSLSVCTVNFNTPEYIDALANSLHKTNSWITSLIEVFDNSTEAKLPLGKYKGLCNVHHVPDSIYHSIDILPPSKYSAAGKYNSARHAKTIDFFII